MLLRNRFVLVAFGCIAFAACGGGGGGGGGGGTPVPTPSPTPTATPSPVTITSSANTDAQPYTVVVNYNDSATVTQGTNGAPSTATLTSTSVTQLFHDVILYAPMNTILTDNGCNKSSSFGTAQTLTYQGITSGDISCPPSSTSPAQTLFSDAETIESQLGLPY